MAKDAKWYAGWLRMASTPTVEEKLTVIETAEFIENLAAELEAVKRERDAAIKDIPRACGYCKHFVPKTYNCKSKKPCACISGVNTEWEWRGVQEDESDGR